MPACAVCGGETQLPKPHGQSPKYCSDVCRLNARREQRRVFVAAYPELAREKNRVKQNRWRATKNDSFRQSKRGHYARHRLRIRAYRKHRHAANPEVARARARQRYYKNRDRIRAREKERRAREHVRAKARMATAKWRMENYERSLESCRRYQRMHPEVVRKGYKTRRARMAGAFIENVDPRVVFKRDDGTCGICRLVVDPASPWEIDHVIPISKGGPHSYANVQLSHRKCNRSKSARLS